MLDLSVNVIALPHIFFVFFHRLGGSVLHTPWTSGEAVNLGLSSAASGRPDDSHVTYPHPVAESLAIRGKGAEEARSMKTLAATQGLGTSLQIAMEKHTVQRIPLRLPGLHYYNPLAAQLDGSLDYIDIPDYINREFDCLWHCSYLVHDSLSSFILASPKDILFTRTLGYNTFVMVRLPDGL